MPPADKTLLIIGQDTLSIEDYVAATNYRPHGVTGYTSLANLEELTEVASYGSGPHHTDRLVKTYPNKEYEQ